MSIKLNAQSGGSVALDAPTQTTSSADNVYKLPVADGSAGQVLQTDGSGNLSWVTPGKILQIQQTIKKDAFETSQSVGSGYTDITGLSVTITPSSTSSKIYLMATIYNSNNNAVNFFRILRGSTFIEQPSFTSSGGANYNAHGFAYFDHQYQDTTVINILDSPSTESATTYKVQTACTSNVVTINQFFNTSNYAGITTLTAMEVAA
tara:strand:- start:62 stop:679 length:618 start_codon:yes stop_codon:yes gene_type:complete